MAIKADNRKDAILLLLYAPGRSGKLCEPITGITKMQKLLFLLEIEHKIQNLIKDYYKFQAYDYGPFDQEIYSDLEALENYGLILRQSAGAAHTEDMDEMEFSTDYFFEDEDGVSSALVKENQVDRFCLTPEKGEELTRELFETLEETWKNSFVQVKTTFNSFSLYDLIKYVYKNYPDYARFSKLGL